MVIVVNRGRSFDLILKIEKGKEYYFKVVGFYRKVLLLGIKFIRLLFKINEKVKEMERW